VETGWAEVTLSTDAEPPQDKLEDLLESNHAFKTAWNHRKKPSPSLSEYEFELACHAIQDGWSDQEIADLLIPYRIKWGDEGGLKKALRKDYIPRTITEARERTKDGAVLKLLPFTVVKVLQYGVADSDIALVLEDGREINVGKTELFLNLTRTKARLWEQGYALSTQAQKHWDKITGELVKLREIVKTATANDVTRGWLLDYARGLQHLPVVSDENPLEKIFASLNWNAMARDEQDRIYVRLGDIARFASRRASGVTIKTVARDLVKLGFTKQQVSIMTDGKRSQINIWVSEPGFLYPGSGL
jgi:hypothetical protein